MAKPASLTSYAEAYVRAVPETVNVMDELDQAFECVQTVPGLASFLGDSSVPVQDRQRAVSVALRRAAPETANFLLLLAAHGVLGKFDTIIEHAKETYAKREGRTYARVASAVVLTNDEVTRIAKALGDRTGNPVLIETVIDESIIGGVRVRIGDRVFDASVRGRLERLKNTLNV
jgi:F-type H+-transporting ATPase subunit delta